MSRTIAILAAWSLLAAPTVVIAAEGAQTAIESPEATVAEAAESPYGVCLDGTCRVTREPRDDDPPATAGVAAPTYTADADAPGRVICHEGDGDCRLVDPLLPVEELLAAATGRLVYGAVDGDPVGSWHTINLPTRVSCKVAGAGASAIKLRRTTTQGSIARSADGVLIGQSSTTGEPPFELVRLGPGLYGSVQPFTDGKVSGEVVSFFGMVDEDTIAGTATMTSTLRDGGVRTVCSMKRNFDMQRIPTSAMDEQAGSVPVESEAPA